MLRHNLLLFFRNIKRHRSSFLINIIGLSTGLACALLIFLWVNDEILMDKFHENDDRLYQVMRNRTNNTTDIVTKESQSNLLAPALIDEFPEVEHVVSVNFSFAGENEGILSTDQKNINAEGALVGKDFFNVFSFPLLQGDADKVLQEINDIVISDELAIKLFGTTKNVLNNAVKFDNERYYGLYNISGVFKKSGYRSSEDFDFLLTNQRFTAVDAGNWISNNVHVFLTLKENVDANEFSAKIKNFVRSKVQIDEPKGADWIGRLFLRPYSDKYLHGPYVNGVQSGGRIEQVVLFSIIGIIILLIACINFMNLSTARVSKRIKEIGIKKVVGASRRTLIVQYMCESLLLAFLSLPLALLIVQLCLGQFNEITAKQFTLDIDGRLALWFFLIVLFTGIVSGSYPAIYLSRFKPVAILKGKLDASFGELWIRRGLVIFQFILSFIFIVSVIVIYKQLDFIQSKDLGYEKDNIITLKKEGKVMDEGLQVFLSEVKDIPGVLDVADYSNDLMGYHGGTWGLNWKGMKSGEGIDFAVLRTGYNFIETLDIEMAAGRTFSKDFGAEESSIIFNEAAIKGMGLENPIGKTVKLFGNDKKIVGVTKNFHFESLYEDVKPCFFILRENNSNVMIKIKGGTERQIIDRIKEYHTKFTQGLPFNFTFMDEEYALLYASEERVSTLSKYFAGIAILISCLGLFGLALFTAERRTKEISIRKVLGSGTLRIVTLLSRDFTKMVITAIVIASPLSYIIAKKWLGGFAYSIDLKWWFFIGAGSLALLIAWFTVGIQTIKAARTNPARGLRTE